jgi:hypothetical protein
MTLHVDDCYKFIYDEAHEEEINIHLEIFRSKIFLELKKIFNDKIKNGFDKNIFEGKKNIDRTINDIFIRWWMTQYASYKQVDPLIFTKFEYKYLRETLIDFIKKCDISTEDTITEFLSNLDFDLEIKKVLVRLLKFKESDFYKKIKDQHSISTKVVNKFIFINLTLPYSTPFLNNIFPIKLPYKIFQNLEKKNNNIYLIYILCLRYKIIDSWNNQLAINPNAFNYLKKEFKINYECFGSAFNVICDNFNSLFYDIEKYYGSKGSFFNCKFIKGFYEFNPPYVSQIINIGIINIISQMNNSGEKLAFLITLPVWDYLGKIEILENNLGMVDSLNKIDYDDFHIINDIRKSEYTKYMKIIPKESFSYLDYYNIKLKSHSIQHTYFIVMSNYDIDLSKFEINFNLTYKKLKNIGYF